jgi:hypothetical protein
MEPNGMTFEVVIDEKRRYTVKMSEMLSIREESLNQILAEHPSQYMWVYTLLALARSKHQRMKLDLEVAEAVFSSDLRDQAAKTGVKVTEKAIENELAMSKRLLQLRRDLITSEEQETLCEAAEQAFRHRKDCLITLGAQMRATADPTLSVSKP